MTYVPFSTSRLCFDCPGMIRGEIVRARLGFGVLPIRSCGGEANNKAIGLRRWDGHAEGAFSRRAIGETRLAPIRESVELTPKGQVEGDSSGPRSSSSMRPTPPSGKDEIAIARRASQPLSAHHAALPAVLGSSVITTLAGLETSGTRWERRGPLGQ
jgi:hypothetical protein